jgi:glycosyltransferase involved in cell wall biosynthesis
VDLARFRPASAEQRAAMKQRAGIDPGRLVVLHVGHMKATRNVGVLEDLARLEGVACVMVASTSTVADREMAGRLAAAGVTLMTHHEDRIEHAYRLADVYLFPVTSPLDAIETPLSVLEAAATDLSIVSTPFGGLPDLLGDGVVWARTREEMVEAVRRLAAAGAAGRQGAGTRTRVLKHGWDRLAADVLEAVGGAPRPA